MELPILKNLIPALLTVDQQGAAYSPAQEKAAKAQGFKNADEMLAFLRQRSQPREQQTIGQDGNHPQEPKGQPQPKGNFLQQLYDMFNRANNAK